MATSNNDARNQSKYSVALLEANDKRQMTYMISDKKTSEYLTTQMYVFFASGSRLQGRMPPYDEVTVGTKTLRRTLGLTGETGLSGNKLVTAQLFDPRGHRQCGRSEKRLADKLRENMRIECISSENISGRLKWGRFSKAEDPG